jgi:hypothetical protein
MKTYVRTPFLATPLSNYTTLTQAKQVMVIITHRLNLAGGMHVNVIEYEYIKGHKGSSYKSQGRHLSLLTCLHNNNHSSRIIRKRSSSINNGNNNSKKYLVVYLKYKN